MENLGLSQDLINGLDIFPRDLDKHSVRIIFFHHLLFLNHCVVLGKALKLQIISQHCKYRLSMSILNSDVFFMSRTPPSLQLFVACKVCRLYWLKRVEVWRRTFRLRQVAYRLDYAWEHVDTRLFGNRFSGETSRWSCLALWFQSSELDAAAILSMMAVGSFDATPLYVQIILVNLLVLFWSLTDIIIVYLTWSWRKLFIHGVHEQAECFQIEFQPSLAIDRSWATPVLTQLISWTDGTEDVFI